MNKKTLFLVLLVVGTAFWGVSFAVTKWAVGQNSYYSFLFYRFLCATIVLSVIFAKHLSQTTWPLMRSGIVLSLPLLFSICMHTWGIQHTLAAQASFIAGMCVVIIPILKVVFYRIVVPIKTWAAALIALLGLFIISIQNNYLIRTGDLYMLIGTFGFAVYLLAVEEKATKGNIVQTIIPMFASCTAITFFLALSDAETNWLPENQAFWTGIAYCALFSTAYMYTISTVAQRYISAEKVAIIYLFEPIFAAIAAYFILGESLSWRLFLGGTLIFIGTIISEVKWSAKRTR